MILSLQIFNQSINQTNNLSINQLVNQSSIKSISEIVKQNLQVSITTPVSRYLQSRQKLSDTTVPEKKGVTNARAFRASVCVYNT